MDFATLPIGYLSHRCCSAILRNSPEVNNKIKSWWDRRERRSLATFEEDTSDYSDDELLEDFESDAIETSFIDLLETSESQLPEERENLFGS